MNPELFLADLERKPEVLADLAGSLRETDPWRSTGMTGSSHVVFLGMGSSHYANAVAAARLREAGIDAVAELASSDLLPRPRPSTVVVAVSASGASKETLVAVERYQGKAPVVSVTNSPGSAIEAMSREVVLMNAGVEAGGVACRTFQHTLALHLALEESLVGDTVNGRSPYETVMRSAEASADLLDRRGEWLDAFIDIAIGPHGTAFVAPNRRLSSAMQGALMLREGPRRPAVGCETGDWSHVDVYLTKTTDYRLVLFEGSRWEPELLSWVDQRGSTLVSVGGGVGGANQTVRYRHDDDDDVRLLTEVLVPELAAATLWIAPDGPPLPTTPMWR
jgi:glucosamine--fructose-6-phosphate aminotransferase (isomerizing)